MGQHLLFSNTRLIKSLSILLFIFFSGTIISNSLTTYYQQQISTTELCDLPFAGAENSCESESHQKNSIENSEEFTTLETSDYFLVLAVNNLIFHRKDTTLTGLIKELPTPPPKQISLTV